MEMTLVHPELLEWAIYRSDKTEADLHEAFPNLDTWLAGDGEPSIAQLEKFARATFTPLGFLFLDSPPDDEVKLTDYRRRNKTKTRISANLRDQIVICEQKQEWYREYAREENLEKVKFIGSIDSRTEPREAASTIREVLSIQQTEFEKGSDVGAAVRQFSILLEDIGVLVMISGQVGNSTKRPLDSGEFSGFSFSDDVAPLIFVNGTETKTAQMFTLAHELAHLFLGESSISSSATYGQSSSTNERWCDQVAGHILMPTERVKHFTELYGTGYNGMTSSASRFKVSPVALLVQWRVLQIITESTFENLKAEYLEVQQAIPKQTRQSSTGNFYTSAPVRTGRRLTKAILRSTFQGRTSFSDAFRMIGTHKSSSLRELGKRIGAF